MERKNGFSLPLVTIFIAIFVAVPVVFGFIVMNRNDNVKGASVSSIDNNVKGFRVYVNSSFGTWDLYEYLCESEDQCSDSLTSGKRLDSLSGGFPVNHVTTLEKTSDWDNYTFIKLYVKAGWGSVFRDFKIENAGQVQGTQVIKIKDNDKEYEVAIVPINVLGDKFMDSVVFSDN